MAVGAKCQGFHRTVALGGEPGRGSQASQDPSWNSSAPQVPGWGFPILAPADPSAGGSLASPACFLRSAAWPATGAQVLVLCFPLTSGCPEAAAPPTQPSRVPGASGQGTRVQGRDLAPSGWPLLPLPTPGSPPSPDPPSSASARALLLTVTVCYRSAVLHTGWFVCLFV